MAEPPTGTTSFPFTDIEGSTKLWETYPDAMNLALARHDALLGGIIEEHGGQVFKTVGDAFCCAFGSASQAVTAALAIQCALDAEDWEVPDGLRVRVAVHTGTAEERGGDYFGPTLNRVARLLSAGHGRQVLLSQAARDAASGDLPPGVGLQDMGEHRLKDLIQPERVFQLISARLPRDFPPLRTLTARLNNLPVQPTPLIGRETEVAEAVGLFRREDVRLVTMTGAGGSGKTRLAVQVGAELVDGFDGGVFFVPLAAINEPALLPSAIAQQLDIREGPGRPVIEMLQESLRDKRALLVLDNFEQIAAAAPQLASLLEVCGRLKMLVTSRSSLRLRAEQEFPVPPLVLPDLRALPPASQLLRYSAVALFAERAAAVRPGFALDGNARAVAEVCVRLDGLPLAIELAAARCKILSPQAILSRLKNRFALLTGGSRDLPERQRTLRATIDWSYELVDESEQRLFRLLSVFVGGFTMEAAEAICKECGSAEADVLDSIASLADKSLVSQVEQEHGEPRFQMLETVREYGLEALSASGEEGPVRDSHASVFTALAEAAEPRLEQEDEAMWLERLEREHDNLRAALGWLTVSGQVEQALRLAASLCLFWFMRGHLAEGRDRISDLLALPAGKTVTAGRARALNRAAFLTRFLGDYDATHRLISESLAIYRQLGDRSGVTDGLSNLGDAALYHGDLEEAERLLEESLEINREWNNQQGIADSLSHLGMSAFFRGDFEVAKSCHEESLAIWRQLGDRQGVSWALHKLGVAMLRLGDHQVARALLRESLSTASELHYSYGIAWTLEGLVEAEVLLGRAEPGVCLAGAAASLREEIGAPVPALWEADLARTLAEARVLLGPEAYERVWAEGRRMHAEEAIVRALAG